MEEALKIRNVLQEFLRHQGEHPPAIVGLREHIFTGRLDSFNYLHIGINLYGIFF